MPSHVKTNQLGALIQSLTSAEKAFFLKLNRVQTESPLYLRLFALLGQQPEARPDAIAKKLGVSSPTQLANIKNQLLHALLDALVYRNRQADLQVYLPRQYLYVAQLLHKQQLALAARQSQKALAMAWHTHQYRDVVQLIEQRQRMLHLEQPPQYFKELEQLDEDWILARAYEHQLSEIRRAYSKLLGLWAESPIRFSAEQMEQVAELSTGLVSLSGAGLYTPFITMVWLATMLRAAYMLRQYSRAASYGKEFLEILRKHPDFIQLAPFIFLETANTLFYNSFASAPVGTVAALLQELRGYGQEQLRHEWLQKWEAITLHTELKIAHKTADYGTVAQLLQPYQSSFRNAHTLFPVSEQLNYLSSLAISHFVLEQYDDADKLMHEVKALNGTAEREDLLYFASLFHLLVLFEKKDWYQLDIHVHTAYQMLYARKKLRDFERAIVLFIKKLPTLRQADAVAAAAEVLLGKLKRFAENGGRQLYFPYFNYPAWLSSKVKGLTYRQYCEESIVGVKAEV